MSLKKKYLKSKPVCKVTFELPVKAAPTAMTVHLVGDFNAWNKTSMPLTKRKTGVFNVTVDLEAGREYAFRYLIDGQTWENDWEADKYAASEYPGVENSVAVI